MAIAKNLQNQDMRACAAGAGNFGLPNYKNMKANTKTKGQAQVGNFSKITLPLIRKTYPQMNASNFVSVQPLSQPSGLIYYLKYRYAGGSLNKVIQDIITKWVKEEFGKYNVEYERGKIHMDSHLLARIYQIGSTCEFEIETFFNETSNQPWRSECRISLDEPDSFDRLRIIIEDELTKLTDAIAL